MSKLQNENHLLNVDASTELNKLLSAIMPYTTRPNRDIVFQKAYTATLCEQMYKRSPVVTGCLFLSSILGMNSAVLLNQTFKELEHPELIRNSGNSIILKDIIAVGKLIALQPSHMEARFLQKFVMLLNQQFKVHVRIVPTVDNTCLIRSLFDVNKTYLTRLRKVSTMAETCKPLGPLIDNELFDFIEESCSNVTVVKDALLYVGLNYGHESLESTLMDVCGSTDLNKVTSSIGTDNDELSSDILRKCKNNNERTSTVRFHLPVY